MLTTDIHDVESLLASMSLKNLCSPLKALSHFHLMPQLGAQGAAAGMQ